MNMAAEAPVEAGVRVLDMRGLSVESCAENVSKPLEIPADAPLRILGGRFGHMRVLGGSLSLDGTQVSVTEPDRRNGLRSALLFISIDDETPLCLTLTQDTSLSCNREGASDFFYSSNDAVLEIRYVSAKDTQVEIYNHGIIRGLWADAIAVSTILASGEQANTSPHDIRISIENSGLIETNYQGIEVSEHQVSGACDVSIHNMGQIRGVLGGVDVSLSVSEEAEGEDHHFSVRVHNEGEIYTRYADNLMPVSGAVALSFSGEESGEIATYFAAQVLNEGTIQAECDNALAVAMIATPAKGSIDIRQDGLLQGFMDVSQLENDYEIPTDILLQFEQGWGDELADIRFSGEGEPLHYPLRLDFSTFDDWSVEGHTYTADQARVKADALWATLLENGFPKEIPVRLRVGYWNIYEGQDVIYPHDEERLY